MKLKQAILEMRLGFKELNIYLKLGIGLLLIIVLEVWSFPIWKEYFTKYDKVYENILTTIINLPLIFLVIALFIVGLRKYGEVIDQAGDTEEYLKKRYLKLWKSLHAKGNGLFAFKVLADYYKEKHRSYHNLEHIKNCLIEFDSGKHLTKNAKAIQFALFYHDAIYYPEVDNNEERSATLAIDVIIEAGLTKHFQSLVESLIIITSSKKLLLSLDLKLMTDIDLIIFGRPEDDFDEYEIKIRQEYDFAENQDFALGRLIILQYLLDRNSIYQTEYFRNRYENQARINIQKSINKLKGVLRLG